MAICGQEFPLDKPASVHCRRLLAADIQSPRSRAYPSCESLPFIAQMVSRLVLNSSSISPFMPVGEMISLYIAMVSLRRIVSPQSPPTRAVSKKFRKRLASGWVSSHGTLSCSVMRKIPRGGIRFVKQAGTRWTTMQKIQSTNMANGNAYRRVLFLGYLF